MPISENKRLITEIEKELVKSVPVKLGINKKNEIIRLVYEICCGRNLSVNKVIKESGMLEIAKQGKAEFFHKVKKVLLKFRYPSLSADDDPHLMPLKIHQSGEEYPCWDMQISPKSIFVEESIKNNKWTNKFLEKFPKADVVPIKSYLQGTKHFIVKDPVDLYNNRRENIFLIKHKSAFIKKCPCTKKCRRCGYWILNIGFGCPIDCAYCYLQLYSNAPGIVLPANIEDYLDCIRQFDDNLEQRLRIGTGEFTDSLALDKYTEYSGYLIPFFRKTKNLIFELKTKAVEIENVLKIEPHENVVISWSINTPYIAKNYEKGGANMMERITAARRAAERGYKVGFHFDPIVYYPGWEKEYASIIKELFSIEQIRKKTAWISLGTLRYTPGLKQAAERRFSDNSIFYYGEFFTDIDGKLRYPRMLRIEMYNKIISWIKAEGVLSWIYLCMEPEAVWAQTVISNR
ncbi:MAG: spore photoproduct lyase family protein [Candidatus Omnitrophota bacterium]